MSIKYINIYALIFSCFICCPNFFSGGKITTVRKNISKLKEFSDQPICALEKNKKYIAIYNGFNEVISFDKKSIVKIPISRNIINKLHGNEVLGIIALNHSIAIFFNDKNSCGNVILLNKNKKKVVWTYQIPHPLSSIGDFDNDFSIIVSDIFGTLYMISDTGELLWSANNQISKINSVGYNSCTTIYRDMIFFDNIDGYLNVIEKHSGSPLEKIVYGDHNRKLKHICISNNNLILMTDKDIIKINALHYYMEGKIENQYPVHMLIDDGNLYYHNNYHLYIVSIEDFRVLHTIKLKENMTNSRIVNINKKIFLLSASSKLYYLDSNNMSLKLCIGKMNENQIINTVFLESYYASVNSFGSFQINKLSA